MNDCANKCNGTCAVACGGTCAGSCYEECKGDIKVGTEIPLPTGDISVFINGGEKDGNGNYKVGSVIQITGTCPDGYDHIAIFINGNCEPVSKGSSITVSFTIPSAGPYTFYAAARNTPLSTDEGTILITSATVTITAVNAPEEGIPQGYVNIREYLKAKYSIIDGDISFANGKIVIKNRVPLDIAGLIFNNAGDKTYAKPENIDAAVINAFNCSGILSGTYDILQNEIFIGSNSIGIFEPGNLLSINNLVVIGSSYAYAPAQDIQNAIDQKIKDLDYIAAGSYLRSLISTSDGTDVVNYGSSDRTITIFKKSIQISRRILNGTQNYASKENIENGLSNWISVNGYMRLRDCLSNMLVSDDYIWADSQYVYIGENGNVNKSVPLKVTKIYLGYNNYVLEGNVKDAVKSAMTTVIDKILTIMPDCTVTLKNGYISITKKNGTSFPDSKLEVLIALPTVTATVDGTIFILPVDLAAIMNQLPVYIPDGYVYIRDYLKDYYGIVSDDISFANGMIMIKNRVPLDIVGLRFNEAGNQTYAAPENIDNAIINAFNCSSILSSTYDIPQNEIFIDSNGISIFEAGNLLSISNLIVAGSTKKAYCAYATQQEIQNAIDQKIKALGYITVGSYLRAVFTDTDDVKYDGAIRNITILKQSIQIKGRILNGSQNYAAEQSIAVGLEKWFSDNNYMPVRETLKSILVPYDDDNIWADSQYIYIGEKGNVNKSVALMISKKYYFNNTNYALVVNVINAVTAAMVIIYDVIKQIGIIMPDCSIELADGCLRITRNDKAPFPDLNMEEIISLPAIIAKVDEKIYILPCDVYEMMGKAAGFMNLDSISTYLAEHYFVDPTVVRYDDKNGDGIKGICLDDHELLISGLINAGSIFYAKPEAIDDALAKEFPTIEKGVEPNLDVPEINTCYIGGLLVDKNIDAICIGPALLMTTEGKSCNHIAIIIDGKCVSVQNGNAFSITYTFTPGQHTVQFRGRNALTCFTYSKAANSEVFSQYVIDPNKSDSLVRQAQNWLIALKKLPEGHNGGLYDSTTTDAVRTFQEYMKNTYPATNEYSSLAFMNINGILDRITLGFLEKEAGMVSVGGSDLVSYTAKVISENEGGYGTVNPNDGNGKEPTPYSLSVGKLQWYAERAHDLLKKIVDKNPSQAKSILSVTTLYNEIYNQNRSVFHARPLNSTESSAVSKLLSTTEGVAVQDETIVAEVSEYIQEGRNLGITDERTLIYFADLYNQRPASAVAIVNSAGGSGLTLDKIHQAALANSIMGSSDFIVRRNTTYQKAKNYSPSGGETGGVTGEIANKMRQSVVDFAKKFVGKIPYYCDGEITTQILEENNLPKYMDCADFTSSVYLTKLNTNIGANTYAQIERGTEVTKSINQLKLGDLVLFDWPTQDNSPDHVGMYIGNGQFIHEHGRSKDYGTTNQGNVAIMNLSDNCYATTYWDWVQSIRRIVQDDGSIKNQ